MLWCTNWIRHSLWQLVGCSLLYHCFRHWHRHFTTWTNYAGSVCISACQRLFCCWMNCWTVLYIQQMLVIIFQPLFTPSPTKRYALHGNYSLVFADKLLILYLMYVFTNVESMYDVLATSYCYLKQLLKIWTTMKLSQRI